MSQKGRLRRLEAGVRWLETEGRYLRVEAMMKLLEMRQDFADRAAADPVFAAEWKKNFSCVPLPPPRVSVRPPAPPPQPVVAPQPVIVPETPPEPAPPHPETPPVLPILRDAALQAAPQDEVVREPAPPAPMPGQPTSPRSPDMAIRPVHWRKRGPQDYLDDEAATCGRCITYYDVLRDEYDD